MPDRDTFTPPAPGATADGAVIIQIVGVAGPVTVDSGRGSPDGQFVKSYDPDAFDGLGDVLTTPDPAAAARFPDMVTAFEAWRTVPVSRPFRGDGKPNRPLTAFTITTIDRAAVVR